MGEPARHRGALPGSDWLPIDRVVSITGESARTWRFRAMSEAKAANRSGRATLVMKAPPQSGGRPVWWFHRSIDMRLSACPSRDVRHDKDRDALIAKYPEHIVHRALDRNRWLQEWRRACERSRGATERELAEHIMIEARRVDPDGKISVRSLYTWRQRYNALGDDGQVRGVAGLIDRYTTPGGEGDAPTRSPEAVEYFYALFHTENKIAARICHDATVREARRRGWRWPATYGATTAWLRRCDDKSLTCLMREGPRAWAHRYLPHLNVDYSRLQPGEMFQGDHTQCDFWVTYKGKQIRPWYTAIQDMRTRCVVGWHLGPTPHQDAIIAALRMAFRDWAIPRVTRIDNGRDFTSKVITGLTKGERDRLRRMYGRYEWTMIVKRGEHMVDCVDPRWLGIAGELGVELIYAIPYAPWSKGTTERLFRTFHGQVCKLQPTYSGASPQDKPECVEAIRNDPSCVPTLDDACKSITEWIDVYHRTEHQGIGRATPLSVWRTATHLRRAVNDELALLCDVRGAYKVGGNGVRLKVGSATIAYGAKSQALKRWVGREVLLAVDANDVSQCWAFTPERDKRRLIARLAPNEYVEPCANADDVREAIAERMRDRKIMGKAARSSARRTKTAVQRINEHSRAERAELLATGTDDATAVDARIIPVRTGFEGVSKAVRDGIETTFRPVESVELADMFDDAPLTAAGDDDEGVDDLFIDEETVSDAEDDGIEGLL